MPAVVHCRVLSPFLASQTGRQGASFVTILPGPIIETSGDLDEPGLHCIRVGDQELFAFTRDINERSERAASGERVLRLDQHNI
jgi:hypothetical protein